EQPGAEDQHQDRWAPYQRVDFIDQIIQKLHVDSVCCFGLRHVGVRKTRHPSEVPAAVRPCYHWAARSPSEPVANSNATGMPAFQKILFYQLVKNFQQPVVRSRCIEFDTEAFGSLGLLPSSDRIDRKSTRLNSSHVKISYAVFCWKKKSKAVKREVNLLHPYTREYLGLQVEDT